MSTKLNENQLIAVHLIASGRKSCEVAEQLNIRSETLSRWRQDEEFVKAINKAQEEILEGIVDTQKRILILSQNVLIKALNNDKLDDLKKSMIALRYLSLLKGKDPLDDKYSKKLSSLVYDNELGLKF